MWDFCSCWHIATLSVHTLFSFQAHSLFNSIAARKSKEDEWRKKAFGLQKLYWGDNSSIDYETQKTWTNKLKSELEHIRDKYRVEIKLIEELVSQFDYLGSEQHKTLSNAMEEISVTCSEDMRMFAREVNGKSVSMLNQCPPCSFEAVAIGSIARGEATPYSDLEFLFLIEDHTEQTVCFFEMLALTSYFLIGNLCETKLSYMAIKELHGWFDDRGKNGFKIDGLTDGAGNIPTGNSIQHRNHFIVTPKQLSERYKTILDNPNPNEALSGDLTAMLTYTVSIYSRQNEENSLLHEFRNLISEFETNQERKDINMEMLTTDAKKFNFVPDDNLIEKGFNADV